ncbi:MAG: hypothetical protein VB144_12395 [Clostridia bacterium]|nr:hypothetical protein [Clostridia bacterium]
MRLPNGTRALSESRPFPDKVFRALGVSLSVYIAIAQVNRDPGKS